MNPLNSLRARFTLRLLLGGVLLLAGTGLALQLQMGRALTGEYDAALRTTAQSLATLAGQKRGAAGVRLIGQAMPQFEREDAQEFFLILGNDGSELGRSRLLGQAVFAPRAGAVGEPLFFDAALPDGRAVRCAGLRMVLREDEDGDDDEQRRRPDHERPAQAREKEELEKERREKEKDREERERERLKRHERKPPRPGQEAVVVVGRLRAPLDHTLAALRNNVLLVGGGALVLLAGLVGRQVRVGLAPLSGLGESVAAVDAASLGTRFPVEPLPAELRPVAARLNELLGRLEDAFARERRFTATAAHELRTPLAELRALAEVNLSTPASEAERAESWRDALAVTRRMESLSLRLLELSRAEHGARVLQSGAVPVARAVGEAWQPWAARAAARGVSAEFEVPEPISVWADPVLLAVVLGNLCANAAEHAPEHSVLRVSAAAAESMVTVCFSNPSGAIQAEDLPRLFERFWRKDAARSAGERHGLGLALAAECAALMGGSLHAQLSAEGALELVLRLPEGGSGVPAAD